MQHLRRAGTNAYAAPAEREYMAKNTTRIPIIEDEPVREWIIALLSSQSYEVDLAADDMAALKRSRSSVNIVETALDMSRMDGMGLLAAQAISLRNGYETSFVDGWLHTGDLAYSDVDGCVTIDRRSKDMIISDGENICPAEIESHIAAHPDIVDAALVGRGRPRVRGGAPGYERASTKEVDPLRRAGPGKSGRSRGLASRPGGAGTPP